MGFASLPGGGAELVARMCPCGRPGPGRARRAVEAAPTPIASGPGLGAPRRPRALPATPRRTSCSGQGFCSGRPVLGVASVLATGSLRRPWPDRSSIAVILKTVRARAYARLAAMWSITVQGKTARRTAALPCVFMGSWALDGGAPGGSVLGTVRRADLTRTVPTTK
jgi:hypothetical protein